MFNKYKLILIGALTSKPYAFNARPWELKNIETIDLFDSLGSNIQVSVRGSEIMRILPTLNENVNEEWITDKTRFAYDGLVRWRFITPLKKEENKFYTTSWKDIFNILQNQFDNFDNLSFLTGPFSSLETITVAKDLSNKIGVLDVLNENCNSNDFSDFYLLKNNFKVKNSRNIYFLIGFNLRLENPLLNLKLKKLTVKNNVLILYIGSSYDNNFDYYHLGNNIDNLYNIFKGNHFICSVIQNFLFKNNFESWNNNLNKDIQIFINEKHFFHQISLSMDNQYFYLKDLLKKFGISFLINNIASNAGYINSSELNFNNSLHPLYLNKTNMLYLIGVENLNKNFLLNSSFIIYQGHHNMNMRSNLDIILPTTNFFEETNHFLNCRGFIQLNKFILYPPSEVRSDWKILKMVSNIFQMNLFYSHLNEVGKRIDMISPLLNVYLKNFKSINFNIKVKTVKLKFYNNFFYSSNFNYYLTDFVSKSSKTMLNCSKTFFEKKSNYKKFI